MRSFKERIARSAGRRVEAACVARPPGTVLIWALCAGASAGIGANVAHSLLGAAVFGGAGALIGYPISWLRHRRGGLSPNMALVMTADAVELLRLTVVGSEVVGTIRTVSLSAVRRVDVRSRPFVLRVTVQTDGAPIVVDTGKRGLGAGRELVEELRRRIAP